MLEAAAKAQATLASGDLQSQMSEMVGKHNNFGGDAVDWRAKAKLKKQVQVRTLPARPTLPACSRAEWLFGTLAPFACELGTTESRLIDELVVHLGCRVVQYRII